MIKNICKYLTCILILSGYSIAQQQDLWTTFTKANGLASNLVNTILESSDGALWFATGGGISYYYEGTWITITTADGLASNTVYAIIQSSDGALWFGTSNGISCYFDGVWTTYTTADGLADNYVIAIIESSDGALWFGTWMGGVSRYYEGIFTTFTTADGLADNEINTIIESSDGALWFGTGGGGASRYYAGIFTTFTTADGLNSNGIRAILESNNGALWFGTLRGGVSRYYEGIFTTFTTADGLAGNDVYSIIESCDGVLWFGTDAGISRYYKEIWTTLTIADGLAGNDVYTILESSDGALWFGTRGGGASRYYPGIWTTFTVADGLVSNNVVAILESKDGALWFGTSVGVSRYSESSWTNYTTVDGLAGSWVYAILESSDRTMWFGTNKGISRYYSGTWTTFTTTDGLADDHVNAILELKNRALWFGTGGGVSCYSDGFWTNYTTTDGLISNYVNTILESNDGALWFGTDGGVSRYFEEFWTNYTTADGLVSNYVNTILESNDGALWFGTGGGVSRYSEGFWTNYTTADGLVSNYINTILESNDGAMWFGTYGGGVSRFYESKWTTFSTADGLADNFVKATIESNNGTLWFGTMYEGVSRLKPDRIPPFTLIFEAPDGIIGTSTPFFSFIGRDYRTKQEELYYSYAIVDTSLTPEGNYWSPFSKYTSMQTLPLQNGTYTFYVKARDRWGNVDQTPATRTFTVDITAPTLVINSPKQEQHIKGEVAIIGSAFDNSPIKDFNFYKLYYGSYISENQEPEWQEDRFTHLKSNAVKNDTLAIFNTLGLEDGLYHLKLWAIDTLKHTGEDNVIITIDNTHPEVQITYAKPNENLKNIVDIRASIFDINIDEYVLEYKFNRHNNWKLLYRDTLAHPVQDSLIYCWENISDSGNVSLKLTSWDKSGNFSIDSVQFLWNNLITPYVEIISPTDYDTLRGIIDIYGTISDVNLDRYLLEYKMPFNTEWQFLHQDTLNSPIENELIYTWQNTSDSGNVFLKLTAWDKDGNSASTSVQFILDNKDYQLPTATIIYPADNAYLNNWISIIGNATDKDFAKYSIYLSNSYLDTLLIESYEKKENEELFVLDTRSFPDGGYNLLLTVWNNKEYKKTDNISITIDNTPPSAKITAPLIDTLSCFVQIYGEVNDDNLKGMTLNYAKYGVTDTSKFILIDTTFNYWNTMELNGFYTLYLSAEDKGGLKTVDQQHYYIDNPAFKERTGLKKTQDELSLYIPPNGYSSSVICIEKLSKDSFDFNVDKINPTDLIFEIHSSSNEKRFKKPGVLTINCDNLDLSNYDESSLSIFYFEDSEWQFIGGTFNDVTKTITATINQVGTYGVLESKQIETFANKDVQLSCQPRVFSPRGSGYNNETVISFYLNKPSTITIKIFNTSGRLICTLMRDELMNVGNNVAHWDGKDNDGNYCVSGLYIRVGRKVQNKIVMVLNK